MSGIYIPLAAAIVATIAALYLGHTLAAKDGSIVDRSRLKTIDGLRAFLALWVLFSHFPIAWGMALTGRWGPQSSPWILRNCGDVAVTAFFMITGMLFYGKLKREGSGTAWRKLYVGRLLRLVPMYSIALSVMVFLVFCYTGWEMRTGISKLAAALFAWGFFTLPGNPSINGFDNTRYVLAGVIWTLRYEWLFYFSLPILAQFLRKIGPNANRAALALGLCAIVLSILPDLSLYWLRPRLLAPFFFGMLAYEIATKASWADRLCGPGGTFSILISLALAFIVPPDGFNALRFVLVFVAFTCIAAGNSVWGLLLNRGSRLLGDASYSTYLLHGLFLSVFFHVLGRFQLELSSPLIWIALPAVTIMTCFTSILTYRKIEVRFMSIAGRRSDKSLENAP